MTDQYVEDFFTIHFVHVFLPLFVAVGVVYFIVLSFRKVGGI